MWLFKHKYLADGFLSRYKTPFVANGSLHQFGVDVDETFSPVVKPTTIRTLLSYATRVGFYHSHCDSSLFICCHGTDIACLSLYVVNIVFIGSSATTLHRVIAFPYQLFSMIDLDSLNYFMGSSVVRSRAEIFLFEEKYAFEMGVELMIELRTCPMSRVMETDPIKYMSCSTCPDVPSHGKLSDQLQQCEPKRKKAKKDVFTVNLYYDGLFTSCPMIYFQGQCKVLTDINFDEMTYVHLLEILKRLVPNGFEKENALKWDRNEELRNTRIKAELDSSDDDYHYSDDDLEEIENVDFHTEGDDRCDKKHYYTSPILTKLCSARVLFRGHVEFGVNEETPQVDPDDNQIDPVYKVKKEINIECCQERLGLGCLEGMRVTKLVGGDSKKPVKKPIKKLVKKPVKKIPDSQSGEGALISVSPEKEHKCCSNYNLGFLLPISGLLLQYFKEILKDPFIPLRKMGDDIRQTVHD
ncbi:ribonuclease H-like domain-containing protein [Tanacetum coccineum]